MTLAARIRGVWTGTPMVHVVLAGVQGSSPREVGASMAVGVRQVLGTIGGGQLEWLAIEHARALLSGETRADHLDLPLGPAIGQCCGGHVRVTFARLSDSLLVELERREAEQRKQEPVVLIFGAGHVGRALARALLPLPVGVSVHDNRPAEIERLPSGVDASLTALPEAAIARAPADAAYVVATHDHAQDFVIAAAALQRTDAAYVGLIGSRTKRRRFEAWCKADADKGLDFGRLVCPIGASRVRDKRPAVIAAMTVAEVMAAFDARQRATEARDDTAAAAP